MSIYPVRLYEWFPPNDEMYENAECMVKFSKCIVCGKKPKYRYAIGHHSIPWGNGDIWCTKKCFNKKIKK